jgi:glutamate dehydrogenase (NAD(P)+)
VAEATDAAASTIGLTLRGARVAIQGFRAVGHAAARRLAELGAVVVAVSTTRGSVIDPDGLDLGRLSALRTEVGDDCVLGYGQLHPLDAVLGVDTDVLIPAAREDLIGVDVATSTTARLVVEGANLPATAEALAVLHQRGVVVVPDFIANAGGIIAAAHSIPPGTRRSWWTPARSSTWWPGSCGSMPPPW